MSATPGLVNWVADLVGNRLWSERRPLGVRKLVVGALLVNTCCELVAVRTGVTANILWAPTTPLRALMLIVTIGPWIGLIIRRVSRSRSESAGRTSCA